MIGCTYLDEVWYLAARSYPSAAQSERAWREVQRYIYRHAEHVQAWQMPRGSARLIVVMVREQQFDTINHIDEMLSSAPEFALDNMLFNQLRVLFLKGESIQQVSGQKYVHLKPHDVARQFGTGDKNDN